MKYMTRAIMSVTTLVMDTIMSKTTCTMNLYLTLLLNRLIFMALAQQHWACVGITPPGSSATVQYSQLILIFRVFLTKIISRVLSYLSWKRMEKVSCTDFGANMYELTDIICNYDKLPVTVKENSRHV